MNRFRSLLVLAFVLLVVVAAGGAGRGSADRHFLGLWEGVDVNDGSKRTISIADRDTDGTFEVAARDSFWTLCEGDRGLELATGRAGDDGVLQTEGVVTCFENDIEIPVRQTYEYSRSADTLFATPVGTSLSPITLHRVSD